MPAPQLLSLSIDQFDSLSYSLTGPAYNLSAIKIDNYSRTNLNKFEIKNKISTIMPFTRNYYSI